MKKIFVCVFILCVFIFVLIYRNHEVNAAYDLSTLGKKGGDVLYLDWTDHDDVTSGTIKITKGTSQVLRFQRRIARVAISDEEICDVQPLDKSEILLYAKRTWPRCVSGFIN